MLTILLIGFVAVVVGVFLVITAAFDSPDHSKYDLPKHALTGKRLAESPEHKIIAQLVAANARKPSQNGRQERLKNMRAQMDARGAAFQTNAHIRPVDANGIKAEWVMAPTADPKQRILYIHGGAYMVGSPQSHRLITSRLSRIANAAVLVVDYRLMPENTRMAGIEDCRSAYKWMLENGPNGPETTDIVIIAGDSSGGNLVLSIAAWVRDIGIRAADALIALSPQTDLTLASPSLIGNSETDIMQGPSFGPIVKAPKVISLTFSYLMHRINPNNPIVSPLLGDLSGLPPTLIQVSNAEMFLDDAVRYVNKSNAQGTNAILQTWPFVMHVWHAFKVPEADEAFEKIGTFIATHTGSSEC